MLWNKVDLVIFGAYVLSKFKRPQSDPNYIELHVNHNSIIKLHFSVLSEDEMLSSLIKWQFMLK